jgi:hypothetical protein
LRTDVTLVLQAANLGRELGVFLYNCGHDEAEAKLFPKAIEIVE